MSPEVELGDVCEITMGQAPAGETYNDEERGFPLIAGAGDFGDAARPKAKRYTSAPTKICKSGDIVLSIRATIGTKVLSDRDYCLGRGVAGLRAKTKLNDRYLWHWLSHAAPTLSRKGRGATFPQVSRSDIAELYIPLPPLDEQRQIAAILDKADALRRKRKRALELLNGLAQSIFLEIFGDPLANARAYPTQRLIELVDATRGISYGIVQRGDDQSDGVGVIRISDFHSGKLDISNLKRTTNEVSNKYKRTILRGGEIVVSIRGTVGRCSEIPDEARGANVSREVAVIPTLRRDLNDFYLSLLRSSVVQRRIAADVKGVAQSGINLGDLRDLRIIQPPHSELERFRTTISVLRKPTSAAVTAETISNSAFSSLQNRAFEGRLWADISKRVDRLNHSRRMT